MDTSFRSTWSRRGGKHKSESLIDIAAKQQKEQLEKDDQENQEEVQESSSSSGDPGDGLQKTENEDCLSTIAETRASNSAGDDVHVEEGTSTAPADMPPMEARFCPFCGGSVQADFKFCLYCGSA